MYQVVATTRMGHEKKMGTTPNYEHAAQRIARLSQVLPGWRFEIKRVEIKQISHH